MPAPVDFLDIARGPSTGIQGTRGVTRLSFGSGGSLAQSIDGAGDKSTAAPPVDYVDFAAGPGAGFVGVIGVIRISRGAAGMVVSIDGAAPVPLTLVTI